MGSNALMNGLYKADHHTSGAPEEIAHGSPGRWIVQKFGGTSVGKFADKIAEDIVKCALSHAWRAEAVD